MKDHFAALDGSGPQNGFDAPQIDFYGGGGGGRRCRYVLDRHDDFPRRGDLAASEDGSVAEVWQGGSAGLAFVAAFESPRASAPLSVYANTADSSGCVTRNDRHLLW